MAKHRDDAKGSTVITRWKSEGIKENQLPASELLEWIPEKRHPDYTVKLEFAHHGGFGYRRVSFPRTELEPIYSKLTYEQVA